MPYISSSMHVRLLVRGSVGWTAVREKGTRGKSWRLFRNYNLPTVGNFPDVKLAFPTSTPCIDDLDSFYLAKVNTKFRVKERRVKQSHRKAAEPENVDYDGWAAFNQGHMKQSIEKR